MAVTKKSYCKTSYAFDKVFSAKDSNLDIYQECIDSVIDGALEGFNTSIMLYGVTGSGKTHTVFGNLGYRDTNSNSDHENGIIYYCFKKLMAEQTCSVELSYLEIYNEQVKDLLGTEDNLNVNENSAGEVVV